MIHAFRKFPTVGVSDWYFGGWQKNPTTKRGSVNHSQNFGEFFMLSCRIWTNVPPKGTMLKSIGSMYCIFTYIYRKNKPNVGNHTIHAFLWERTVGWFLGSQLSWRPTGKCQAAICVCDFSLRAFFGFGRFCFWWHFLGYIPLNTSCLATCQFFRNWQSLPFGGEMGGGFRICKFPLKVGPYLEDGPPSDL